MTAEIDRRSRRAVLAAAASGAAALAAAQLVRPEPASANGTLTGGTTNTFSGAPTTLTQTDGNTDGVCINVGISGTGLRVTSYNGDGIVADATNAGVGVSATSGQSDAIRASATFGAGLSTKGMWGVYSQGIKQGVLSEGD